MFLPHFIAVAMFAHVYSFICVTISQDLKIMTVMLFLSISVMVASADTTFCLIRTVFEIHTELGENSFCTMIKITTVMYYNIFQNFLYELEGRNVFSYLYIDTKTLDRL